MKNKISEKAEGQFLIDYLSNGYIYKIPEYQRKYT